MMTFVVVVVVLVVDDDDAAAVPVGEVEAHPPPARPPDCLSLGNRDDRGGPVLARLGFDAPYLNFSLHGKRRGKSYFFVLRTRE